MVIKTKNELETINLAIKIASLLQGGEIILLNGDLGSGKTTFVKGIAKYFAIKKSITSPTFTIMKTYPMRIGLLVHVDAYRLEDSSFEELEDFINNENIIFVEWSSYLKSQEFFKENLSINITYISKNQRKIELVANGSKYEKLLKGLIENV